MLGRWMIEKITFDTIDRGKNCYDALVILTGKLN